MSDVVDLNEYKKKKQLENYLARNRTPLYVNNSTGKITGDTQTGSDFADKYVRLNARLERINRLMNELKRITNESKPN